MFYEELSQVVWVKPHNYSMLKYLRLKMGLKFLLTTNFQEIIGEVVYLFTSSFIKLRLYWPLSYGIIAVMWCNDFSWIKALHAGWRRVTNEDTVDHTTHGEPYLKD